MSALWALLPAVALGWLTVRLSGVTAGLRPRWAAQLCLASLGAGLGVAIAGAAHLLLLRLGAASRTNLLAFELALVAGLVLAQRYRRSAPQLDLPAPPAFRWNAVLLAALGAALALLVAIEVSNARSAPYGNWDAFAIWNLRAKFLLAPGDLWKNAVSPLLERTHPEYPLLLSSFIARTWRLAGGAASPGAPLATAFLFAGSVLALLASLLALSRGLAAGLLACFVLLATTSYIEQISWQYADIPLSFYLLATFGAVLLGALDGGRRRPALLLAGAFASCAALTKNEGAAFLAFSTVACAWWAWRSLGHTETWRQMRWWLAGALPGLLLLADFRLLLAPPADPLRSQSAGEILAKFSDPSRYAAVAGALVREAAALGDGWSHPLVLLALLGAALRFEADPRFRLLLRFAAATLAAMLLTYCAIYVARPEDLAWLLGTSLARLYAHLWPSTLLLAFLALRPLGERSAEKSSLPRRKKAR
jgi:hypothetical protein